MMTVVVDKAENKTNAFDIFDKIYCINLDRRQDRWVESEIEFKKHGLNVTRISAIDGSISDGSFGSRLNKKRREAACLLSHLSILKSMVKDGLKKILILEDDIAFVNNLNELFSSYITQVPVDWDMIYLGGHHVEKPTEISTNISKLTKTYTTSHYAITNKMASKIISEIDKHDGAVDVIYSKFHSNNNCYVFTPHLAWQRPNFSDILNKNIDYEGILK